MGKTPENNRAESSLNAMRAVVGQARALQKELDDLGVGRITPEPPGGPEAPTSRVQANALPLVGVGGKLRAGKDTVADLLVEKHGYSKTFMSETLAEALYRLDPLVPDIESDEHVPYRSVVDRVGYTEAKKIPEVRRLLQALGTEVGRELLGEDIWTTAARRRIESLRAEGKPVVITGIRFPNEAAMVRELGGVLVWIERPVTARQTPPRLRTTVAAIDEALAVQSVTQHASEVTLEAEDFDYVILNDGPLDKLRQGTEDLLAVIGSKMTP